MSEPKCKDCPVTAVDLKLNVAGPKPGHATALPNAEFLVVVWTEAEAGALALVFGKGLYHFDTTANNNFTPLLLPGAPKPADASYHGFFFPAEVNGKTVVCFKSEFHPKAQTAATTLFLEKIIGTATSRAFQRLVTSGTAGGIWNTLDVGDVVVANHARYGMTLPAEKQSLRFTGLADLTGGNPPQGYANWFDYATDQIIQKDECVDRNLRSPGGRRATAKSAIYCKPSATSPSDVVTNSRISEDECAKIATYRTMGATLDENDAYVAEACEAIAFQNWVSIRNVSDLPCSKDKDQYDTFGFCSSINGAYAVWAFIMGH